MVVYKCSQSLYHQLHQFSVHHRVHRRQPVPVHLQARRICCSVYSQPHCHLCGFDVGGRCCPGLTEPRWVVVAQFRHQDSEVFVGPHHWLPLHHPVRRRRHAAAVYHHDHLLLAHLLSYSPCQAACSQDTVPGKTRHIGLTRSLCISVLCIPSSKLT